VSISLLIAERKTAVTKVNDKNPPAPPPQADTGKPSPTRTVNDLEPKDTFRVKGGRRMTADPDEGGE
jgi:hypothetical protein